MVTRAANKTPARKAKPGKPAKRRADYGTRADPYFAKLKPPLSKVALRLRKLVRECVPGVRESIKYGVPHYETQSSICSISVFKRHVSLLFWLGSKLDDPGGLLQGTASCGRFLKFESEAKIDAAVVKRMLKQARELA